MMKIKVGVMGSAAEIGADQKTDLRNQINKLAQALAARHAILFTGATTGLIHEVGKAAQEAGVQHVGISPGSNESEHRENYKLPIDNVDVLVFTGFGLKGRNVVLVRSCDIVIFIAGAMGSLNEFTIAHDEGKIIGCLTGTGGVADQANYLLRFAKQTSAKVFQNSDPDALFAECLQALFPDSSTTS
jgi:uncharacterized protein (TIGR00725 family)